MGPHKIPLISAHVDQNNIFKIVLDIETEQAERLLYQWPTSEARIFDECVKLLKNLLCKKPRGGRRPRGFVDGKNKIQSEVEYQTEPNPRRHPRREDGDDSSD